jgi:hypothetical protein
MVQATPTPLPLLHHRYRIEQRLGIGRLAVVYRAYDERLERPVLIHLLRRELIDNDVLRDRFLQEAQNSARRSHRSLLDVYDTGELAGRPYIVTEYVAGHTLRDIGALSPEDALLYFRQIVGAVAACQAAGVHHPPISSSNVILVDDGHVELVESWLLEPEEVPRDLASYRPPERTAGAPSDPAGVVYSLGLLLIEMLTGRRLVQGATAQEVAQAHAGLRIPPIAALRPAIYAPLLDDLVQRMTARDPALRPPDAAALAQALDDVRAALTSETRRLPVVATPSVVSQVRQATGRMRAASPRTRRQSAPAAQPSELPAAVTAPPGGRSALGLGIMAVMFAIVAVIAYTLATYAVEGLADIRLPRPEISLPSLGINLPEWLTGVAQGGGQILEVNIRDAEGLNLRSDPGLQTPVIALLPNGTRVRKLSDTRIVDDVEWVRVRASISGQELEGWVSARYVRPV